jgi:DNA-binding response OmpR family regulator/DNA-binding CsgD family transcriptional regulator
MSSPAKILVVDDTPANLALVLDALGAAGHELLVAESGRSALSLLGHNVPDLILLDVVMPGIDGFATCERIKARPECRDVPVLFMTALDEPEQKVRAFEAGAVDYITKPVHVPEVLARIAAHLQIRSLQKSLAEELAARIEAENQLAQSLDRAVVLADAAGRIVFSSRLAEDLLHKHFPARTAGLLPAGLGKDGTLEVRRFSEPGRSDLQMLVLEERGSPPGPAALTRLGLTPREAEVLYWIAQGKSNPDIATILGANVRTVHKHVEHIFQKLGLETRNAAALAALEVLRPAK